MSTEFPTIHLQRSMVRCVKFEGIVDAFLEAVQFVVCCRTDPASYCRLGQSLGFDSEFPADSAVVAAPVALASMFDHSDLLDA